MASIETIIKHVALFVLLGATSIWAYTDTGEPYVALVACIIQILFFYYDSRKNKEVKEIPASKKEAHNSIIVDNITQKGGVIQILNTPQPEKTKETDSKKLGAYYNALILANTLYEYKKIQHEFEFEFMPNKTEASLFSLNPDLRMFYEKILQVIDNISKDKALIILSIISVGLLLYIYVYKENIILAFIDNINKRFKKKYKGIIMFE